MMPQAIRNLAIALLALAGLAAGAAQAQDKVSVVASFSILGDMAREIGGEDVAVRVLVGPDGDAHVYQPSPADAKAVSQASVLLVNGLGFEGWMDRLQRAAAFKGRMIVASAGVTPLAMAAEEKGAAPFAVTDPHAWQNPANAGIYADNIAAGLSAADPAHAAAYARRAADYKRRLAELDARLRAMFATITQPRRRVITTHDAFQYFGHAYGIEFIAAVGISTDAEPSARQVAALIAQIRKENVKALFVENMSDKRLIEQIARDAGGVVGGELYPDALSPSGGPADTYIRMIEHNAALLKAGMERN